MKTKLIIWIMSTRLYWLVASKIVPYVYIWFSPKKPIDGLRDWLAAIEDGDILLCRTRNKLSSYLIPGPWDHAAIATPEGVVEMVGTGWRCISYEKFWKEASSFAVMSFRESDNQYSKTIYENALALKGTPYDLQFKLGIDALYCSELPLVCDTENRGQYNLEDFISLGRPYISPYGIYNAIGLHVVYEKHY